MTHDGRSEDDGQLIELRHRYRNSLQVLQSITGLHARGIEDPAAKEVFAVLRARLEIIAKIFTDLDDEPGDTIDISVLLPRIAHSVANRHDPEGKRHLQLSVAEVRLVKTRAGMLAQIFAEMLMAVFRQPVGVDPSLIDADLVDAGEHLVLTIRAVGYTENGIDTTAAQTLTAAIIRSLSQTLGAAWEPACGSDKPPRLIVEKRADLESYLGR